MNGHNFINLLTYFLPEVFLKYSMKRTGLNESLTFTVAE